MNNPSIVVLRAEPATLLTHVVYSSSNAFQRIFSRTKLPENCLYAPIRLKYLRTVYALPVRYLVGYLVDGYKVALTVGSSATITRG